MEPTPGNPLVDELPEDIRADVGRLSPEEQQLFFAALVDPKTLGLLYSVDYTEVPVPPEVFFSSPYYFGKDMVWDPKEHRGLFPVWFDELCYVLNPDNRMQLTVSIVLSKPFDGRLNLDLLDEKGVRLETAQTQAKGGAGETVKATFVFETGSKAGFPGVRHVLRKS